MLAAKQHERLRWRCRRGILELDLLLSRFLTDKIDTLDESQAKVLDRLLTYPDQDLFDWLMARKVCDDASLKPMLELIQRRG